MNDSVISVRQLNLYVKSLLDGQVRLQNAAVIGEISNFKNHYASGHWYFTLKDSDAAIRCVMFRFNATGVRFTPSDGMQVIAVGRVSIYEKDGSYQLYAEQLFPAGEGAEALKFEEIKNRLQNEGLFDAQNKRPLPKFPKNIAVITSGTGAAVQDILNITGRRWPMARIIMCPVSVQGKSAVPEMLSALERVYASDAADVIIIGRGGGSAEDLREFNDETLARKIYESPVPVISAVGHETDFSICDFVADMRAPTPSAAAELAVPDSEEVLAKLNKFRLYMRTALKSAYESRNARLIAAVSSPYLANPLNTLVFPRLERSDRAADKILSLTNAYIEQKNAALCENAAKLDALSPLKVLARGYAAVLKDGRAVKSVEELNENDTIDITLADGKAVCRVTERERFN